MLGSNLGFAIGRLQSDGPVAEGTQCARTPKFSPEPAGSLNGCQLSREVAFARTERDSSTKAGLKGGTWGLRPSRCFLFGDAPACSPQGLHGPLLRLAVTKIDEEDHDASREA